jgi:hypothetical protein
VESSSWNGVFLSFWKDIGNNSLEFWLLDISQESAVLYLDLSLGGYFIYSE